MMSNQEKKFEYNIIVKDDFLIVTFIGKMDKHSLEDIDKCIKEILDKAAKFTILNMQGVDVLNLPVYRSISQLRTSIHKASCHLRICSLKSTIKQDLIDKAIVIPGEFAQNLEQAIKDLSLIKKSQKD